MGYGRGKVGSIVLARSKGQQIARAYNEAPKNPRSEGQMLQRSIFASAVKFFSQGRQAFFQFAFENKPTKRSDYNMFVSANAKAGQHISKAAYEEQTYPVLCPFKMTSGSLAEVQCEWNENEGAFVLPLKDITSSSNWGAVSSALISMYGFNGGDIITFTTIEAEGSNTSNTPAVSPEKRQRIVWNIKQAKLDVDSSETVSSVMGEYMTPDDGGLFIITSSSGSYATGVNITVSRQTLDGLKVSDSFLVLNKVASDINDAAAQAGYIGNVLSSWKTSGKAILEGGLLE